MTVNSKKPDKIVWSKVRLKTSSRKAINQVCQENQQSFQLIQRKENRISYKRMPISFGASVARKVETIALIRKRYRI